MDVLNVSEELTLYDVELRHQIPIPDYSGKITTVYIFIDKDANTYHWETTSYQSFEEGKIYDIKCICNRSRGNRLTHVKVKCSGSTKTVQSEQPAAKPDAEDVLLGLKDY